MIYTDSTEQNPAKDTKALSHTVEGTNEDKGITRKISIIKELVNIHYTNCRDISDYLHSANSAYPQL